MGKKNIDKLFQEKFNGFEEIPEERVWNAISTSLDKKKSRKLIPFWWKLGGVAALLAILMTIINPFEDDTKTAPVITDTEKTEPENPVTNHEDVKILSPDAVAKEVDQVADTNIKEANSDSDRHENEGAEEIESSRGTINSDAIKSKSSQIKTTQLTTSDSGEANKNRPETGKKEKVFDHPKAEPEEGIAKNGATGPPKNPVKDLDHNLPIQNQNEEVNIKNSVENAIANTEKEEQEEEQVDDIQKKSIFDEIKEQNEEEVVTETSKGRWSVGANVAPVYFNSFGEGSPIDPAFTTNSKSGDLNLSYGLSVAYNVNNRLSVRTGVHKVDFSYDTNGVEFSASLQGSLSARLNNVNYTQAAENVVITSKAENSFALANSKESADVVANNISRNGIVAQEFGYLEVPVELDYALVDKRFGVNLIGGVSTLFLTNNSVALNDSNETIELGEANNLNNINFSTNVGFGLNYKFTPKVRLNVEPVFKYQVGTFSETSGSFNPFSVGVYSGLNFRF